MSDLHFHRRHSDEAPEQIPAGMTVEQLDFFTLQTERAVNKALRSFRNRALQGFLLLLVGLMVLTYVQRHDQMERREATNAARDQIVESGRAVALTGCNRDFQTAQAFQATIKALRDAAKKRNPQTPETAMAVDFYDEVLEISPLPDCRKAENIVTQDPTQPIIKIDPFYPGADYAPKAPTVQTGNG